MGQFLAMLHGFMALQTGRQLKLIVGNVKMISQGITYMDEKGRLDRFDKNLWLIGIACMHYLHEMVEAELTNINDPRAVRRPIKGKNPGLKSTFGNLSGIYPNDIFQRWVAYY